MRNRSVFLFFFIGVVTMLAVAGYMDYIHKERKILEKKIYEQEALFMQKNVAAMIEEKKKATTAIALTLASNDELQKLFADPKELHYKLNRLIFDFKKYTNYKNIWIHILDKDAHTLYRSWTKVNDDTLCSVRKDLYYVIRNRKILSQVSADLFTLNIKAIVPLYNDKDKFIGLVEVISHFNSISKGLKKLGVDSVVVANENNSKLIKYPFTEMYIQNCYVANFDAPQVLQEYLKKNNIKQYCRASYNVENGFIISSYPLKNFNGKTVAYYIMFKKIDAVSKTDLEYFVFKWSVYAVLILMALAGVVNLYLYYVLRQQKAYYKKILDTLSNIVLINDKKKIIDANKTFFKYFSQYKTIEEFRKENSCICNFFVQEDGYLDKGTVPYSWLDYILERPDELHKVKMKIQNDIYYFSVNVSLISEEKTHYSVIFSDITKQEIYKTELEELSLSDPLTNVGNRRKFEKRLKEEIARACRYKEPLSIIFYDIDHFKQVNDKEGHVVGDAVLVEYAKHITSLLRDVDEVFRVGGEEFVIIAPHTTQEAALVLAEKLRKAIEEYKKIVPITASFGVAEYKVCENEDSFYKRADDALYKAKESGRNRVVGA
jgi:diguanylate cyclase (GGDEF)-like protein